MYSLNIIFILGVRGLFLGSSGGLECLLSKHKVMGSNEPDKGHW